jgi:mRNA interferase RelE/StbE
VTATYKVSLKKSAEKELRSIPSQDIGRIVEKIKHLEQQLRPHGCEKMEGGNRYRIRQGDWRVIYTINDSEKSVMVFKIGNRREVYR